MNIQITGVSGYHLILFFLAIAIFVRVIQSRESVVRATRTHARKTLASLLNRWL